MFRFHVPVILLSLLSLLGLPVLAQDERIEVVYQPNPLQISIERTQPFFIYFPYSNPSSQKNFTKVTSEIRILGSGFELVNEEMYDLYYPDGVNTPVDCTRPEGIPSFPISAPVASTASIVYGLQTAENSSSPSGTSVGDLPPAASGCVQVGVTLSKEAIIGQTAQVRFNWYSQDISDPQLQPPVAIYNLEVGSGTLPSNNQCTSNQELVDGVCQPKCRLGEVRSGLGTCVDQATLNEPESDISSGANDGPEGRVLESEFNAVRWLLWISLGLLTVSIGLMIAMIRIYILYTPKKRNPIDKK